MRWRRTCGFRERPRRQRHGRPPEELDRSAAAQIGRRADQLLPDRAERDSERGDQAGGDGCNRDRRRPVQVRREDESRPDAADQNAGPAPQADTLAQQRTGEHRGQQRLQAGDQGRHRCRKPVLDGPEDASDIDALHQGARGEAVEPAPQRTGPRRTTGVGDAGENQRAQPKAEADEGFRVGIRANQPRDDEAGGPQQDEQPRRDAPERDGGTGPRSCHPPRSHPACRGIVASAAPGV